jgi:hypothetical protein
LLDHLLLVLLGGLLDLLCLLLELQLREHLLDLQFIRRGLLLLLGRRLLLLRLHLLHLGLLLSLLLLLLR